MMGQLTIILKKDIALKPMATEESKYKPPKVSMANEKDKGHALIEV